MGPASAGISYVFHFPVMLDLSDPKASLGDYFRDGDDEQDQYGGWDAIPELREHEGLESNRFGLV
jgi:hypothetical protein